LQRRLGGRVRHLQISLSGDGLVLRGFARTYHAKQLAQHAMMSETSLAIMANEIEVCDDVPLVALTPGSTSFPYKRMRN
jgi:hypothetical protein